MWLTEFRAAHGLSIEQLGRAVRMRGKKLDPPIYIRDTTIINLEREPGYLVIPAFANLIAEVCGATAEQRDALTLPKHAGTWMPTGMPAAEVIRARVERAVKENPTTADAVPLPISCAGSARDSGPAEGRQEEITRATHDGVASWGRKKKDAPRLPIAATNALARAIQQPAERPDESARGRAVVSIDTEGKVLATYRGPSHAAKRCGISKDMVLRRCARMMKSNEFAGLGYTFRFRDDWERMTDEERCDDLSRTFTHSKTRPRSGATPGSPKKRRGRATVVIDPEGHEIGRYSYAKEAAEAMKEAYSTVVHHCMLSGGFRTHYTSRGRGYFYADEWDGMDEDAKAAATLRR